MKTHLIAVGGAVMHNLALALKHNGFEVTGSDDEIYEPSRSRLADAGLLPDEMGWHPERITTDLDAVILGMHARPDNPELKKAQELDIPIYSFPEYIYENSKNKTRIVVAGSHGKTTTTAMIMHVLKYNNIDFDYLVGAQLEGFERMVRLSDAPFIILEGDEYLSSPIDRRPKFVHYHPHIAILTGIEWDHINVFPTFENYLSQFELLLDSFEENGTLIFYQHDEYIKEVLKKSTHSIEAIPYEAFDSVIKKDQTFLKRWGLKNIPLKVFGAHNLSNLRAAYEVCMKIGIDAEAFYKAIQSFDGAAKRLELLYENDHFTAWKDFAHAPSKVRATTNAVKAQFPHRKLVACLELHTFSSLNKVFLPNYSATLNAADVACVYYSEHTLQMKKLPPISPDDIRAHFNFLDLKVFTCEKALKAFLKNQKWKEANLLMMSSGRFNGLDLKGLAEYLAEK
jgi:UDP-N-acetylmuramate: L-alanyl-gamma-D-glutamyl-meso-diaminopimelate ligase